MSVGYAAVGWNRQKKIYDWLIFGFCMLYLLTFATLTTIFNPDYTFETLLIRSTSTLAVLLLHIILSIGPLARLNKKFLPLLYNRRHLGVTMFCIAAVHGVFSILQFHTLGNPFVSLFTSNTNFNPIAIGSVASFPFQSLGFFALIILFLMAITSHDFWLHNLSPRFGRHYTCLYTSLIF
jgi:DMSO/TMAO reductase YedYZ heme-binding membrane subunit